MTNIYTRQNLIDYYKELGYSPLKLEEIDTKKLIKDIPSRDDFEVYTVLKNNSLTFFSL